MRDRILSPMIWQPFRRICCRRKKVRQRWRNISGTAYNIEKDIAKLADILGHSSIETTRIYIMSTVTEHRRRIERLGLVL